MNLDFYGKILLIKKRNEVLAEQIHNVDSMTLAEGFITVIYGGGLLLGYSLSDIESFSTVKE